MGKNAFWGFILLHTFLTLMEDLENFVFSLGITYTGLRGREGLGLGLFSLNVRKIALRELHSYTL